MAGIIVSGGTYSGSGDMTIDWLQIKSVVGSLFQAPENLYITNATGGYSFWTAMASGFEHQDGTVLFSSGTACPAPESSLIDMDSKNGMGSFYNLRITDNTTRYPYNRIRIDKDFTIDSGSTASQFIAGSSPYHQRTWYSISGALICSGTFDQSVYNGWSDNDASDGTGLQYFGYIKIGSAGTFNAYSGSIYMNARAPAEGHSLTAGSIENIGTYIHNSGTLQMYPYVYGPQVQMAGSELYNLTILQPNGERDTSWTNYKPGGDETTVIANDLHIYGDGNVSNFSVFRGASSIPLIVSGAVYVSGGRFEGNAAALSMGGIRLLNSGSFKATSDTLTLTDLVDVSYAIRADSDSPFEHNDGTVLCAKILGGVQELVLQGSNLYNLNIAPVGGTIVYISNNEQVAGLTVANDLNVAAGKTFKTFGAGNSRPLTVSGTATVSGTLGVATETSSAWTFGTLDIKSGGTYIATSGTTIIKQPPVGAGKFYNLGTFTHNNGLVSLSGASQEQFLGPNNASMTFYDLELQSNEWTNWDGAAGAVTVTIENSYNSYKANRGMNMTYNNNKLILGSATGSCTFSGSIRGVSDTPLRQWYVEGASELYPAIFKRGTDNENQYSIVGNTTGSDGSLGGTTHVKWVDFSDVPLYLNSSSANGDFILDASSGSTFWNSINVPSATIFDIGGQRAEFGGLLSVTGGIMETTGSLMVLHEGVDNDGSWNGEQSTDIMISGGTGWLDLVPPRTLFAMGDTQTLQLTAFTKIIQAGGTTQALADFNSVDNLIIANGGTITHQAGSVVDVDTSFSNRGGLFASSSALDLDGTEYATMGDGMATATAVTLESWVKPSEAPYENTMIGTDGSRGGILSSNTLNKFRIKHESVDGSHTDIDYDWVVDKWQHMCFTWDGSTGKAYADGKLIGEWDLSGSPYGLTKACIGSLRDNGDWPWEGNIGRASFWKAALTAAEVREMMFYDWTTVTASSIDQTDCVGWYQFDEGEGGTISDMSGSGNTATITGSTPWGTGGTWTAGGTLSSSAGNLYIGNRGAYATEFASSYFPLGNVSFVSGSKWTSKAHSGSNDFYIGAASGTTFSFSQIANEPQQIVRDVVPPTGGSDVVLTDDIEGGYIFIFDEGENDQGTAKDCDSLTVESDVTIKALTGVDYYTQHFTQNGTWVRDATYDGDIHDDGSLPTEYEPIDFKQHIGDAPIDAGLKID